MPDAKIMEDESPHIVNLVQIDKLDRAHLALTQILLTETISELEALFMCLETLQTCSEFKFYISISKWSQL